LSIVITAINRLLISPALCTYT